MKKEGWGEERRERGQRKVGREREKKRGGRKEPGFSHFPFQAAAFPGFQNPNPQVKQPPPKTVGSKSS